VEVRVLFGASRNSPHKRAFLSLRFWQPTLRDRAENAVENKGAGVPKLSKAQLAAKIAALHAQLDDRDDGV
jgi:hypothetical protein